MSLERITCKLSAGDAQWLHTLTHTHTQLHTLHVFFWMKRIIQVSWLLNLAQQHESCIFIDFRIWCWDVNILSVMLVHELISVIAALKLNKATLLHVAAAIPQVGTQGDLCLKGFKPSKWIQPINLKAGTRTAPCHSSEDRLIFSVWTFQLLQ